MTYRVEPGFTTLFRVPDWFVSVTLDTSVVIGGRWWGASRGTTEGLSRDRVPPLDWSHPDLARWSAPLAPARLRIGGTEADRILYGFRHDGPATAPDPAPDADLTFVLKGRLWKQVNTWARDQGFDLLFTVAAGPESRDAEGRWDPRGAERLLRQTIRKGYPVAAWEFGNEVNAYPFLYGMKRSPGARQYIADFAVFAERVRRLAPGALTAGPASAIWPLIGEPNPLMPRLGRSAAAAFLDVLSFHYYPQQSERGRVAVRRARQTNLLNARALDGLIRWVRHARRSLAGGPGAGAALWITEIGHALYGGQEGVSDTWLSTPWWLDQLGLAARSGVQAVFRQSLVGGDYGLLDPGDYSPRPDWFATKLWKLKMGPRVLAAPQVSGPDRRLRVYHHGRDDGSSCLLLINLSRTRTARTAAPPGARGLALLTPYGPRDSRIAALNGRPLVGEPGLELLSAPLPPPPDPLRLPPLSCAFVDLA